MATINHTTSVDRAKANQHKWGWFDLRGGNFTRVGYQLYRTTHWYNWSKFTNPAKSVVHQQIQSENVDLNIFKRIGDHMWDMDSMKLNAGFRAAMAGVISGHTDDENTADDDQVAIGIETASIVAEIIHKLAGSNVWFFTTANYAQTKHDITTRGIPTTFIFDSVYKVYGFPTAEVFAATIHNSHIETGYTKITEKYPDEKLFVSLGDRIICKFKKSSGRDHDSGGVLNLLNLIKSGFSSGFNRKSRFSRFNI